MSHPTTALVDPSAAVVPDRPPLAPPDPVRPRWWRELLIVAGCYAAYSVVRNLVPTREHAAMHRAGQLLHLERLLRLDVELDLNETFTHVRWLGVAAGYYYATLHFVVTIGVLVWLYAWHPDHYRFFRRIIFGSTLTGLAGFWLYPLAPPRMLPGFVDTVLNFHTWGLYGASPMAAVSDQYAAMPSLHTAWSLWCAVAVLTLAHRRWVRGVAACYPVCTVTVILGTANHFVLDAVGGALALGLGLLLAIVSVRTQAVLDHPGRTPP